MCTTVKFSLTEDDSHDSSQDVAQPPERRALTLDQCAERLQVSPTLILKFVREGHLKAFVRPGARIGVGVGRKSLRIFEDDFAEFCQRNTQIGVIPSSSPAPPLRLLDSGPVTGTDGIMRRRKSQ